MKPIEIDFKHIKPVSVNHAYYKYSNTLTTTSRKQRKEMHDVLKGDRIQKAFKELREAFKPNEHGLEVTIIHYVPKGKLRAKAGHLSRMGGDVDNIIKQVLDFVFNQKVKNGKAIYPHCVGIDDINITRLISEKQPSADGEHSIKVTISII